MFIFLPCVLVFYTWYFKANMSIIYFFRVVNCRNSGIISHCCWLVLAILGAIQVLHNAMSGGGIKFPEKNVTKVYGSMY